MTYPHVIVPFQYFNLLKQQLPNRSISASPYTEHEVYYWSRTGAYRVLNMKTGELITPHERVPWPYALVIRKLRRDEEWKANT